jgi:hypothetical protein
MPHCGLVLYSCSFQSEKSGSLSAPGSSPRRKALLANDVPTLHARVLLGLGQEVRAAGGGERRARREVRGRGGAESERVEPDSRADASRLAPPVPQVQDERRVGHPGHAEDRDLERTPFRLDTHHVLVAQAVGGCGGGAHEQGVLPGDLGHRVRELLEPCVVRALAVLELRARHEEKIRVPGAARERPGLGGERGEHPARRRDGDGSERAVGEEAIVENAVPAPLEVLLSEDAAPRLLHDLVAGAVLPAREKPDQLHVALAPVERQDQRLDHAERGAERARVAPRLEEMGARHVPRRERAGLVHVRADVDELLDLAGCRGEVQLGRRVVGGVAAEHDQGLDAARSHRSHQLGEAAGGREQDVLRLAVLDRVPDVAERRVQDHCRRVDGGGLARADEHERRPPVGHELGRQCAQPRGVEARHLRSRRSIEGQARLHQLRGESCHERGDVARPQPQPLVGVRPGDREDRLHGPETAHRVAGRRHAAPRGEAARVADHLGIGVQEVRVDREDRLRLVELVHGEERASRRPGHAFEAVLVAHR